MNTAITPNSIIRGIGAGLSNQSLFGTPGFVTGMIKSIFRPKPNTELSNTLNPTMGQPIDDFTRNNINTLIGNTSPELRNSLSNLNFKSLDDLLADPVLAQKKEDSPNEYRLMIERAKKFVIEGARSQGRPLNEMEKDAIRKYEWLLLEQKLGEKQAETAEQLRVSRALKKAIRSDLFLALHSPVLFDSERFITITDANGVKKRITDKEFRARERQTIIRDLLAGPQGARNMGGLDPASFDKQSIQQAQGMRRLEDNVRAFSLEALQSTDIFGRGGIAETAAEFFFRGARKKPVFPSGGLGPGNLIGKGFDGVNAFTLGPTLQGPMGVKPFMRPTKVATPQHILDEIAEQRAYWFSPKGIQDKLLMQLITPGPQGRAARAPGMLALSKTQNRMFKDNPQWATQYAWIAESLQRGDVTQQALFETGGDLGLIRDLVSQGTANRIFREAAILNDEENRARWQSRLVSASGGTTGY
jgi:hypothetical protein